ncbi:MAG TPA: helix-turn-helix domain-containing protein [Gemmatimonadales bacterium]|nr:helix-turn-helix domain-containing protein [Gemmatimonadales bacterium]
MPRIDLTPFGFTPTESLVYEVLLTGGPGTGYAVARAAGLARANAYSALEALVQKGAARADAGRPKRYRPEPPAALVARIANRHGEALDVLGAQLHGIAVPASPSLVEIDSPRAALQLITHDVARARESVEIYAPADAYPLLAPALRRALAAGAALSLRSAGPAALDFTEIVQGRAPESAWPGTPLIAVVDGRSAVIAARRGPDVSGHWSTAPSFIAAARLAQLGLLSS